MDEHIADTLIFTRRRGNRTCLICAAERQAKAKEARKRKEIVHLVKSPANARALGKSIEGAREGKAVEITLGKLDAGNRTEAVTMALQQGLIEQ